MILLYGAVLAVFALRKDKKKGDFGDRMKFGLTVLLLGFITEFVGVTLKLWTLLPGNWPITVWISYFGMGLLVFEVSKYLKEIKKRT